MDVYAGIDFNQPATLVAPQLLGATLTHHTPEGSVSVRLSEVEAYLGHKDSVAPDPGSHGFRGMSERNAVMYGPPAHIYVYFTYGMHYCMNLVCSEPGTSSGVLLRAGEVTSGRELATRRRTKAGHAPVPSRNLARGPACLAQALGVNREHNGELLGTHFELTAPSQTPGPLMSGPRVGVSGEGGTERYPYRYWLAQDPTVSAYKAATTKKRVAKTAEGK